MATFLATFHTGTILKFHLIKENLNFQNLGSCQFKVKTQPPSTKTIKANKDLIFNLLIYYSFSF
jgi:hypothetical protein